MHEGQVMADVMFPTNQHATVVAQPTDGSFNDPTPRVSPQLPAVFVAAAAPVASIRAAEVAVSP